MEVPFQLQGMEAAADDETVCSFCGMSHLMYAEMRKKERRITELETMLAQAGGGSGADREGASSQPVTKEATRSHYEQLQQMQESCAKKLEGMAQLEKRLADAEKEASRLRAAAADAGKALAEEKRQRQVDGKALAEAKRLRTEEVAKALAERDAMAQRARSLEERSDQLACTPHRTSNRLHTVHRSHCAHLFGPFPSAHAPRQPYSNARSPCPVQQRWLRPARMISRSCGLACKARRPRAHRLTQRRKRRVS